ncbi:ABC transporter substrate-binding protein [Paenibacillus baekrokdamisoli]|uniref:ABC transporter substrate-binding protein n=1 Tax=Paenibacillus baekrokdamisoli TaxID=1712516 RepID=A0A3G9IZT5_9BACL|nr:extracellular solute-binding protein [Paenibacillus baekrokdamisoli]MBB3067663.1 ABC-type glycerol-3-phosphate transport system substrate-binding protein [Paenibacillus baekrokdamisoli]BBH19151.1 ABC transporter substrate-binding protein [Paenibacillus baekrokdamisoli]
MKKRLGIILTAALMVSLLAGCSKSENKVSTDITTPEGNKGTNSSPVEPTGGDSEAFTIRASTWFFDDTTTAYQAAIEKKYKEMYPNATIQWDVLLGEKYFDKLKTELATNSAADVIFFQNFGGQDLLNLYNKAGYLTDLSDQPWVSTVVEASLPFLKSEDGKVVAAGTTVGGEGFWYNKKIFADNGLTAPTNWDEFIKLNEALKAKTITPIVAGFKDQWTLGMTLTDLIQTIKSSKNINFDRDLYDGKEKINGPEYQEALDKFAELTSKGFFNKNALTIDWPQSRLEFAAGKAGMIYQGNWLPGMLDADWKDKGLTAFDVGYFAMPAGPKPVFSIGAGDYIAVNAKTKYVQQSKDLLSAIIDESTLSIRANDSGSVPIYKDMKVTYTVPATNDFLALFQNGIKVPGYALIPPSVGDTLLQAASRLVAGEKLSGKELEDAQKNYDKDKGSLILPK